MPLAGKRIARQAQTPTPDTSEQLSPINESALHPHFGQAFETACCQPFPEQLTGITVVEE
jgi:hypothetical protein